MSIVRIRYALRSGKFGPPSTDRADGATGRASCARPVTRLAAMQGPTEQPGERAERLVVFEEEINLDPPLVELLAEIEGRLRALAARYGAQTEPEERFELVDSALDVLDSARARSRCPGQARASRGTTGGRIRAGAVRASPGRA
jgi:hypothetical protein